MGFFEKLRLAIRKIRVKLIAYTTIMLVVVVIGLAPFTVAVEAGNLAREAGDDFWATFYEQLFKNIQQPITSLGVCFSEYLPAFLNGLKWYILFFGLFALIGIIKSFPKHEFQDIENGSSDWSENGEQYAVLSKNKGIILAEKNRLPVDKRGNVNVLVVRRFWCW